MADAEEDVLLGIYRGLDAQGRRRLLACAEALAKPASAAQPQPQPRPAQESVVLAIRRLVRRYPMLDRRRLMGPASALLAQNVLQGRAAAEVIDELELLFERHCRENPGTGG
jgi:hypothetical protein